ncbi:hypothetical protein POTOM_061488 [Populus tomentosa]|uniref:Glutaredoxin domain-containing protein n=1 Tax=Populus tomentosa TaxID=118781 RepID=A0A8X7XT20_POPTO|nr:hypothetical protein POTOM_061488 [Populus tomentosa]
MERVTNLASERPVVIFSKSTCCMCHTIKTLFNEFGVSVAVHELDEMPRGREIEQALSRFGCPTLPAVFIGGELVGGANEVMSLHLNRSLIPMLKRAGALWGLIRTYFEDSVEGLDNIVRFFHVFGILLSYPEVFCMLHTNFVCVLGATFGCFCALDMVDSSGSDCSWKHLCWMIRRKQWKAMDMLLLEYAA